MFIESNDELFARLERCLAAADVPVSTRKGRFQQHVDEIAALATTHTVFLYVDPIAPGDLKFDDLRLAYNRLRSGQSIETLVNFLSTGFVRRAQGLRRRASTAGALLPDHHEVVACNEIAGGGYWQSLVYDQPFSQRQVIDAVAEAYAERFHRWFRFVLNYPVRERYEDEQPKYHLTFGTRHPDAIDLMNRAMVKARREFVGERFVEPCLFPNQPKEEVIDPADIAQSVLAAVRETGRTTWKRLRVQATICDPCRYTDSEFNRAIKQAIASGKLGSSACGTKVEEDAEVWPVHEAD